MSGDFILNTGREPGLNAAIQAANGVRALARLTGVRPQSVQEWRRVPRARLFAVAQATGLDPAVIRPDLADWVTAEKDRQWRERARARFAVRQDLGGGTATVTRSRAEVERGGHAEIFSQTMDLLDLGLIAAALRFAAAERSLTPAEVMAAKGANGQPTAEQSARAYAMALAVVVGRVSSRAVAGLYGVSRQAVDNAADRYLRARDGDGDLAENGKVMERGRARRAKAEDPELWEAERRFVKSLAGDA
jgi:DNA-binding transcriptional regulator YdaS (Cro superfamily)